MKRWLVLVVLALLLTACGGGPVRRVSEPAASIQQLTVRADGSWSVDLRLQNYSSIPMRFDAVDLTLVLQDQAAGALKVSPGISIGPESADVVTVTLAPASLARIAIADALSDRRSVGYSLEGSVQVVPEERKSQTFTLKKRNNSLNPVPGLPGVLR
ncbi:LEA type 2 family protein [Luteimonas aquatica]|uniref:NDR1/HIN1-like protein n=1 Tax=Luteimonas aquatica TaxID=450364 RepID=UPI001F58D6FF|nr:LEA type 2 family protein [Luteimonas aquatica]